MVCKNSTDKFTKKQQQSEINSVKNIFSRANKDLKVSAESRPVSQLFVHILLISLLLLIDLVYLS